MAEKMGWQQLDNPFEYHFDRPIYYHYIAPDMIVGSQPRNALDVDHLAAEGVTTILNLQQVHAPAAAPAAPADADVDALCGWAASWQRGIRSLGRRCCH